LAGSEEQESWWFAAASANDGGQLDGKTVGHCTPSESVCTNQPDRGSQVAIVPQV